MIFKRNIQLSEEEKISNEQVIKVKRVILQLTCSDYGITPLSEKYNNFGQYGQHGITGSLFITNYRLFFKSDKKYNRLVGQLSIFYPSIIEVKSKPLLTLQQVYIKTYLNTCEFNFAGIRLPIAGLEGGHKLVDEIYAQLGQYDQQNDHVIHSFIQKNSQHVYKQFTVKKKLDNFLSYGSALLRPKLFSIPKNEMYSTLGKNKKNENCLANRLIEEYRGQINS